MTRKTKGQLKRAGSELKEIGHRLLGIGASLERVGTTGKPLPVYKTAEEEISTGCDALMRQLMPISSIASYLVQMKIKAMSPAMRRLMKMLADKKS